jgi:hypothetical protein
MLVNLTAPQSCSTARRRAAKFGTARVLPRGAEPVPGRRRGRGRTVEVRGLRAHDRGVGDPDLANVAAWPRVVLSF